MYIHVDMDTGVTLFFFFLPMILGLLYYLNIKRKVNSASAELFDGTLNNNLVKGLQHFPYFSRLGNDAKIRFATRVSELLEVWDFYGHEDLEVQQAMEVYVCATAVQLTFGLDDKLEDHFTEVHLYPEPFYIKALDKELKGAASPQGSLYLSWSNFAEGIRDPYDGVNLGLHEMAHALMITAQSEGHHSLMKSFSSWMQYSSSVIEDEQLKYSGVLRKYAFTNKEEFFAVCVEHFFEEPEDLRSHLPKLYENLCDLLNQDPSNIDSDYRVEISAWKPAAM